MFTHATHVEFWNETVRLICTTLDEIASGLGYYPNCLAEIADPAEDDFVYASEVASYAHERWATLYYPKVCKAARARFSEANAQLWAMANKPSLSDVSF